MDAVVTNPRPGACVEPALYTDASLREKILEHILIGELLKVFWQSGRRNIEVLRAEVDCGGYDLVLDSNGVVRHIQLKSSYRGASTAEVDVNVRLASKPGGCVLWVQFDPQSLELGPFLWYGGPAGEPLPSLGERVARHSRGSTKSFRPNIRVLTKGKFKVVRSVEEIIRLLFGEVIAGS